MALVGAAGAQDAAQERQAPPPETAPLQERAQPPQKAVPIKDIFDVILDLLAQA